MFATLLFAEYPRDMQCRILSGSIPPPLSAKQIRQKLQRCGKSWTQLRHLCIWKMILAKMKEITEALKINCSYDQTNEYQVILRMPLTTYTDSYIPISMFTYIHIHMSRTKKTKISSFSFQQKNIKALCFFFNIMQSLSSLPRFWEKRAVNMPLYGESTKISLVREIQTR